MPIGRKMNTVDFKLKQMSYGQPGSGKTTGALTLANRGRVLLIDVEGGAEPVALRQHGIEVENIEIWPPSGDPSDITFDSLDELIDEIRDALDEDPDAYFGIVIDSYSELNQRLLDIQREYAGEKAERLGKDRERFQTDLADYGVVSQQLRNLLRRFRDLPVHLVITALERRDLDENTGKVTYGPSMSASVSNDATGLMSIVVWHVVDVLGEDEREFFLGVTSKRENHIAKDRLNVLPVRMVDPSAMRIIDYVNGDLHKDNDELQALARAALSKPTEKAGDEEVQPPADEEEQPPARESRRRSRAKAEVESNEEVEVGDETNEQLESDAADDVDEPTDEPDETPAVQPRSRRRRTVSVD